MTRARKNTGRIAFIGTGPGDPGLLTRRATELLGSADYVVHDPFVPGEVLALAAGGAEISAAEGLPGDVAKMLLSAARSGATVLRLVTGDPFSTDDVVLEVKAVARTAIPFEAVPGIPVETAVPTYAGVPTGGARTVVDLREGAIDWATLAAAPGTLVLTATSADLPRIAAGLAEHGRPANTPVAVTLGGATDLQVTIDATVETLASVTAGMDGPLVVMVGTGVALRSR